MLLFLKTIPNSSKGWGFGRQRLQPLLPCLCYWIRLGVLWHPQVHRAWPTPTDNRQCNLSASPESPWWRHPRPHWSGGRPSSRKQDINTTNTVGNHQQQHKTQTHSKSENDCTKRKQGEDGWPALRGAEGSRSRRRLAAPGGGGQVCPSSSLAVAAGRWLWSGHIATEGINMDDTAYQMVRVTISLYEHSMPT